MKTRIHQCDVDKLTKIQYQWMATHNLGETGRMRKSLYRMSPHSKRYIKEDAFTYKKVIWLTDKDGQMVAWSLLRSYFNTPGTPECYIDIWVCRPYRRQGLGRKLLKKARLITGDPTLNIMAWDDYRNVSEKFQKRMSV